MSVLSLALEFTLPWEGGDVEHPDDPGGRTKFGISTAAHPGVDIENLTIDQAADIYKEQYWLALRLDTLPAHTAVAVFDAAVNLGKRRAVQLLQQAVNCIPSNEGHLAVDGILGPITRSKVALLTHSGSDLFDRVLDLFLALAINNYRIEFYTRLAKYPSKRKFFRGWVRRATALTQYLMQRRME